MRLFEAILDANRRQAADGEVPPITTADFAPALPVAALTCIDARLNRLLPDRLGLPDEQFIWLRNAGNIITGPLSSTMRSLALACAVKGAKEIAVIGHSDCQVAKMTMLQLLERLAALGVDRQKIPDNLVGYFGLFGSERQNVIRGVDTIRASPLIGPKIPVHGLLLDLATGRIEWVVNGYEAPVTAAGGKAAGAFAEADKILGKLEQIGHAAEELKVPTGRIGEVVSTAQDWLHRAEKAVAAVAPQAGPATPAPPPVSAPPAPAAAANPLATLQERMRRLSAARPGGRGAPKR